MNASTTITIDPRTVESALVKNGAGHYSGYAGRIANAFNRDGLSDETAHRFVRDMGAGRAVSPSLISSVVADLRAAAEATDTTGERSDFDGFDLAEFKANAAEVIRAFISDDSNHDGGEYDEDEVTALLILAGLEDEPVVEPVAVTEETVDAGLFQRLVAFARRHGFTG